MVQEWKHGIAALWTTGSLWISVKIVAFYMILPHNPCWVHIITRKSGKSKSFEVPSQISILRCNRGQFLNYGLATKWNPVCSQVGCLGRMKGVFWAHQIPASPQQHPTKPIPGSYFVKLPHGRDGMAVLVLSMDFGLKCCLHGIWSASIPSIAQNLVKIISKRDHGPCVIKLATKSLWPSISHWTHRAHHFLEWTALKCKCQTHKVGHESNLKHIATPSSLVLDLLHLTS